jgi:hypothetical protein
VDLPGRSRRNGVERRPLLVVATAMTEPRRQNGVGVQIVPGRYNACGLHYAKLTRKMGANKAATLNLKPRRSSIPHRQLAI